MCYAVLDDVSIADPPDTGRLLTRYTPLRQSPACIATPAAPRLACVKPAASVHPEPGSNSSLYNLYITQVGPCNFQFLQKNQRSALSDFNRVKIGTCLYLFSSYSFNELPSLPKRAANVKRFFESTKFIFKKSQKVFFCYFTSTHPPGTEAPIVLSYIASQTVDGR